MTCILAAPTFIAAASSLHASVLEIFWPRATSMRDERMGGGGATAFDVYGGGRELVALVSGPFLVVVVVVMIHTRYPCAIFIAIAIFHLHHP